jgi:hypothetical protein
MLKRCKSVLGRGVGVFAMVAIMGTVCQRDLVAAAASTFPIGIVISEGSTDNQHCAIATSANGRRCVAAWDGSTAGGRRVFLRESVDGVWLPAVVVDVEPTAANNSPCLAVDDAGNCHVAWLALAGEKQRVVYAARLGGVWSNWGVIDGQELAGWACEALTLRLDGEGRPWLTWQAGNGSQYGIRAAHIDPAQGTFVTTNLTPGAQNYNIYPDVQFTPQPVVFWYSAIEADFSLVARSFSLETGVWQPYEMANLSKLPANRFPYLMRLASGRLLSLWFDRLDASDRVLVGHQSPDAQGTGDVIDHQPDASNHLVSGAVAGEEAMVVWCSETATSGSQVYLSHGLVDAPYPQEALISDGARDYYVHPHVAPLPDGAAVIYLSSTSDGGDGRVLFRHVTF